MRTAAATRGLLAIVALAGGLFLSAEEATAEAACTHYAAPFTAEGGRVPAGKPTASRKAPGSARDPYTVSEFWRQGHARPGAVLCLQDGLYRGPHSMIAPRKKDDVHGTAAAPVVVRALNDGEVWIDGERAHGTIRLQHDYWTVSGVNAFNSKGPALAIRGAKQLDERDQRPIRGIVLRRIVAWRDFIPYGSREDYDAVGGANVHVVDIADAKDILLEDCAAFGSGRKIFQVYRSQRVTLRRNWARWDGRYPYEKGNKFAFACSYKSYDVLCENLIATAGGSRDPSAMPATYLPGLHLIATDGTKGGMRWVEPQGRDPHNLGLRILGSIAYVPPGARFQNVAGFHIGGSGFPHKGQKGVVIENSVAYVPSEGKYAVQLQDCKDDPEKHPEGCSWSRKDGRERAPVVVERVTALGGKPGAVRIEKDWRKKAVRVVSKGTRVDPYRARGDGAAICTRIVDGRSTDEPLWPWPMQERILAATQYSNWETADVMRELRDLFGDPPTECTR